MPFEPILIFERCNRPGHCEATKRVGIETVLDPLKCFHKRSLADGETYTQPRQAA